MPIANSHSSFPIEKSPSRELVTHYYAETKGATRPQFFREVKKV